MDISTQNLVARLAMLTYDVTGADTGLLDYAIENAKDYVKTYCNIKRIPAELNRAVINVAAGMFLYEKAAVGALKGTALAPERAASVSEGDVSVSYDSNASVTVKALIDDLKQGGTDKHLLDKFRRLKW